MASENDSLSYLVYIIPGIFVMCCVRYGGKLRWETFSLNIIGILTGA